MTPELGPNDDLRARIIHLCRPHTDGFKWVYAFHYVGTLGSFNAAAHRLKVPGGATTVTRWMMKLAKTIDLPRITADRSGVRLNDRWKAALLYANELVRPFLDDGAGI